MSILKHFATFSGFTSLSRVAGYVRDSLLVHFIGKSIWLDTFLIAYKFSNCFRRFFAEGALNVSLVPELVKHAGDDKKIQNIAQNAFSVLLFTLGALVLGVELFADKLIPMMISRYEPDVLQHTITMVRINFPYSLLIALCAVCTAILNTKQKFYAESALPIILNLCIIAGVYFTRHMNQETMTTAMSWSVMAAGFIQFAWVYYLCKKQSITLKFKMPDWKSDDTKFIIKKTGKNSLISSANQINLFADLFLATFLPAGSVAVLFYADRLNQLPLSIIGIGLGVVLLPNFSRFAGNLQQGGDLLKDSIICAFQIVIPVFIFLSVFATDLVYVLFCHGKFTISDTLQTGAALKGYLFGLPAIVLVKIFLSYLFANDKGKIPFFGAVASIVCNISCCLLLMPTLKATGMAIATSLAGFVNLFVLGAYVYKTNPYFNLGLSQISKQLLWSGVILILTIALRNVFPIGFENSRIENVISLLSIGMILMTTYFVVGYKVGIVVMPALIRGNVTAAPVNTVEPIKIPA